MPIKCTHDKFIHVSDWSYTNLQSKMAIISSEYRYDRHLSHNIFSHTHTSHAHNNTTNTRNSQQQNHIEIVPINSFGIVYEHTHQTHHHRFNSSGLTQSTTHHSIEMEILIVKIVIKSKIPTKTHTSSIHTFISRLLETHTRKFHIKSITSIWYYE